MSLMWMLNAHAKTRKKRSAQHRKSKRIDEKLGQRCRMHTARLHVARNSECADLRCDSSQAAAMPSCPPVHSLRVRRIFQFVTALLLKERNLSRRIERLIWVGMSLLVCAGRSAARRLAAEAHPILAAVRFACDVSDNTFDASFGDGRERGASGDDGAARRGRMHHAGSGIERRVRSAQGSGGSTNDGAAAAAQGRWMAERGQPMRSVRVFGLRLDRVDDVTLMRRDATAAERRDRINKQNRATAKTSYLGS